tara:strand:+ start:2372 stop:2656 length:285 start_codon:yes stop_codon:yes gene_type:complete
MQASAHQNRRRSFKQKNTNNHSRGSMNYKRQNLKTVTHEEIESAMKRFMEDGGTIKHLQSQYENPNLNYDTMENEERQMVFEITGVKNSGIKIN